MTVITKAISEKKPAEKMEQPLVLDDNNSEVYLYFFKSKL